MVCHKLTYTCALSVYLIIDILNKQRLKPFAPMIVKKIAILFFHNGSVGIWCIAKKFNERRRTI